MAAEKLQVVALISGGKDSFYSLLHCIAQGHDVIALANLFPPRQATAAETLSTSSSASTPSSNNAGAKVVDDLESHMYQTVGHSVVPLYAEALGLPLYRGEISGSALDKKLEYQGAAGITSPDALGESVGDEIESLTLLLRRVMHQSPTVNAVCAGAILSTYQRTRVESVAAQLELISLAPLWQYPSLPCPVPAPGSLLEDLSAAGLDARIIKVASGGLDESFLWSSLSNPQVRKRLAVAVNRFGGSVLGEGGEFETLVVSGPQGVWKRRIAVPEEGMQTLNLGGGEALLRIGRAELVPEESGHTLADAVAKVRMPRMLDTRFEDALQALGTIRTLHVTNSGQSPLTHRNDAWSFRKRSSRSDLTLQMSNLTGAGSSAVDQVKDICADLRKGLNRSGLEPDDVVFTTILLRSMEDFAAVNAVYATLFTKPLPPARATVAIGNLMPKGVEICLSVTASFIPKAERSGLHVQSRSYWAPANIGPYSQAIATPLRVGSLSAALYVAGQIPLEPSTMQPLDTTCEFRTAAALSAQHMWRIGVALNAGWWTGAIAYLSASSENSSRAKEAGELWSLLHVNKESLESEEVDAGFDIWHQRHGNKDGSLDAKEESHLPDFEHVARATEALDCPGFLAVEVDQLPRGCSIEWQSLGLVGENFNLSGSNSETTSELRDMSGQNMQVAFHEFSHGEGARLLDLLRDHSLSGANKPEDRQRSPAHATLYTSDPAAYTHIVAQIVPCSRIWGRNGVELLAGLVLYDDGQRSLD